MNEEELLKNLFWTGEATKFILDLDGKKQQHSLAFLLSG